MGQTRGYGFMRNGEPRWALHIRFKDGSNPIFYRSLTVKELSRELSDWNRNYKLWPDTGNYDFRFIWILAERREKDANKTW